MLCLKIHEDDNSLFAISYTLVKEVLLVLVPIFPSLNSGHAQAQKSNVPYIANFKQFLKLDKFLLRIGHTAFYIFFTMVQKNYFCYEVH